MKMNRDYYFNCVLTQLGFEIDLEESGISEEQFEATIREIVDSEIDNALEFCDDEEFDFQVFENDLINKARRAVGLL